MYEVSEAMLAETYRSPVLAKPCDDLCPDGWRITVIPMIST
jgi:hypothetical protein